MPAIIGGTIDFPDPALADGEGIVAVGGDLSPERIMAAYRRGIFPWSINPVTWWSPDPRGVFELERFHVSQSLARVIRGSRFTVTRDQAFAEVIRNCAAPGRKRRGVWLTPEFISAYTQLNWLGHAHSVECWQAGQLAGGIYGVSLGGFFAGESMFHHVSDASKVALHHLVQHRRCCTR